MMSYNKHMQMHADKNPLITAEEAVEMLNSTDTDPMFVEGQSELKSLIDAWSNSGRNLQVMGQSIDRSIAARLFEDLTCQMVVSKSGPTFLRVLPFRTEDEEVLEARAPDSQGAAITMFRQLLIDNTLWKIGGPCSRCGVYFLRKTRHAKHKYCSRACGSDTTARELTTKRNEAEHQERLRIARNALSAFQLLSQEGNTTTWQDFVLEELRTHGHKRTISSLTRWVNDEKREAGSGLSIPEHLMTKGDR